MPSSRIVTIRELAFNKNKSYHFVTRLNAGFYSDLEEDMFKEIPTLRFFVALYDFKIAH
jgi:hypothetical protein